MLGQPVAAQFQAFFCLILIDELTSEVVLKSNNPAQAASHIFIYTKRMLALYIMCELSLLFSIPC